jgi:CNT family concentrative nucleoside transporter
MSIPASLAISKLRFPEDGQPLTAGEVTIPEDEEATGQNRNAMMTFSDGAWLGLKVAGMMLVSTRFLEQINICSHS